MKAKLIKTEVNYLLKNEEGVIIASTSLKKEGLALSLKYCQAIERGYDFDELEELAQKEIHNLKPINPHPTSFFAGYRRGFQKALEILGDKKFSEDDVISMIEKSRETGLAAEYLILTKQQTEVEVEIVMEEAQEIYRSGVTKYIKVPKLDADGCLILKRK